MSTALAPIRRIVTGNSPAGRSAIIEDGLAPVVRTVEQRPGFRVTELWRTCEAPANIDSPDSMGEHRGISPPHNGTLLRIIDMPPEPTDPAALKAAMEATFQNLFAGDAHREVNSAHPTMHRTDTIDYAILLSGELIAVMDDGETVMKAGDVLIQRGTNHGWRNKSGKIARIAFILVDGTAN